MERYEYDAYGNTKVFNAEGAEIERSAIGPKRSADNFHKEIGLSPVHRYAFQGREIDWETGLYYFRARWYDSETGRWLSKDPIGIAGGLNLYEAFGNNAVNFVDPFGLDGWSKTEQDIGTAALAGMLAGLGIGGILGFGIGLAITFAGIKISDWKEANEHWKETKKE